MIVGAPETFTTTVPDACPDELVVSPLPVVTSAPTDAVTLASTLVVNIADADPLPSVRTALDDNVVEQSTPLSETSSLVTLTDGRLLVYDGQTGERFKRPVTVGYRFDPVFYDRRYWIDPYRYHLRPVLGWQRWVRYGNDVVLVDIRTGRVLAVENRFFF